MDHSFNSNFPSLYEDKWDNVCKTIWATQEKQLYNLKDEFDQLNSQITELAQSLWREEVIVSFSQSSCKFTSSFTVRQVFYRAQQVNFLKMSFGLNPVNFICTFPTFFSIVHWPVTSPTLPLIKIRIQAHLTCFMANILTIASYNNIDLIEKHFLLHMIAFIYRFYMRIHHISFRECASCTAVFFSNSTYYMGPKGTH